MIEGLWERRPRRDIGGGNRGVDAAPTRTRAEVQP